MRVCKHYLQHACLNGNDCRFEHPVELFNLPYDLRCQLTDLVSLSQRRARNRALKDVIHREEDVLNDSLQEHPMRAKRDNHELSTGSGNSTFRSAPSEKFKPPSPSKLSTLPDDTWISILSLIEEPILWTVCRRVSHAFRYYVDRIFINDLLPKTFIEYDNGLYCTIPSGQPLALRFQFIGLSDNQTHAYFKDPRNDRDFPSQAFRKDLIDNWRRRAYESTVKRPAHTLQVDQRLNDTELPGLKCNFEERILSVDWRGMYEHFFREEAYHHLYMRAYYKREVQPYISDFAEHPKDGAAAVEHLIAYAPTPQQDARFFRLRTHYPVQRRAGEWREDLLEQKTILANLRWKALEASNAVARGEDNDHDASNSIPKKLQIIAKRTSDSNRKQMGRRNRPNVLSHSSTFIKPSIINSSESSSTSPDIQRDLLAQYLQKRYSHPNKIVKRRDRRSGLKRKVR